MACLLRQFAEPFPFRVHGHHRCAPRGAEAQAHAVAADFEGPARPPYPLAVGVVGRRAHEVAHHAAVVHLDERGGHRAVLGPRFQITRETRLHGERLDRDRARSGDGHDGAERMGAVVVEVEPAPPVVDRVSRHHRHAVDVGVGERAALVDIFVFGVHQVAEQTLPPAVGQPHVGGGVGIVLGQVVDALAPLDLLDQPYPLGRREKRGHLGEDMLARLQALDRVGGVRRAEGGEQDRVEILTEEGFGIVGHEGAGAGGLEMLAHVRVEVAARDHVDVEERAGLEEIHSPSEPPDAEPDPLVRVEDARRCFFHCHLCWVRVCRRSSHNPRRLSLSTLTLLSHLQAGVRYSVSLWGDGGVNPCRSPSTPVNHRVDRR